LLFEIYQYNYVFWIWVWWAWTKSNPTPWSQPSPPPNCAGAMVSTKSVAKLEGTVGPVEFRHRTP